MANKPIIQNAQLTDENGVVALDVATGGMVNFRMPQNNYYGGSDVEFIKRTGAGGFNFYAHNGTSYFSAMSCTSAGAWTFPVALSVGNVSSYTSYASAGSGVANGASYTYTGYTLASLCQVRVTIMNLVGANTPGASADFIAVRYGTGTNVTTVIASGYAVTIDANYNIVLTNNTGGLKYPLLSVTRIQ